LLSENQLNPENLEIFDLPDFHGPSILFALPRKE
jgi:hypothetical protein